VADLPGRAAAVHEAQVDAAVLRQSAARGAAERAGAGVGTGDGVGAGAGAAGAGTAAAGSFATDSIAAGA